MTLLWRSDRLFVLRAFYASAGSPPGRLKSPRARRTEIPQAAVYRSASPQSLLETIRNPLLPTPAEGDVSFRAIGGFL